MAETTYRYTPFGVTTASGEDLGNPFRYTGQYYDTETGLYNYKARYYSPEMGRFLSEDPIDFAGGDVNLYTYVGNSPLNFVDPLGLAPWDHLLSVTPLWNEIKGFEAACNNIADKTICDAECVISEGLVDIPADVAVDKTLKKLKDAAKKKAIKKMIAYGSGAYTAVETAITAYGIARCVAKCHTQ